MKKKRSRICSAAGWMGLLALTLVAAAAESQENPHGDLDISCEQCHTTEAWRPLRDPIEFDHTTAGFNLAFGHDSVRCTACHTSLEFRFVATACADCHDDPHRGELGFGCEDCHVPSGWDNRRQMFDVHEGTLFPLTGMHATIDCADCHRGEPPFEFALAPIDCFACHDDDFLTPVLDHVAVGFPTECQLCHSVVSWQDAHFQGGFDFDHDPLFELSGAHRTLDCMDCHESGFAGTPIDCVSCHLANYEATDDPDHVAAGFPTDCELCHDTGSWDAENFDHDSLFRLTGEHRNLDCEECHSDGFAGTPTQCVGCHRSNYNQTDDPDHKKAGIQETCEDCHGTSTWQGAVLDHDQNFRLTGAHRGLDCQECHADGFAGTPRQCVGCHRSDYNQTTDPDHQDAGFPTMCEDCHDTKSWAGADFAHETVFRLTGAHKGLDCEDCHADGFTGTPDQCVGCHRDNYDATSDPNHQDSGFGTQCENCHDTKMWEGAEFDHNSAFRLTGAHKSLDCEDCHADGFAGTPRECVGCHQENYASTTDPDHQDAGFPTDCEQCHNTSDWGDAELDHSFFPLTKGHSGLQCDDCHADGFNNTPNQCVGCHQSNYDATTDPDHQDAGFPTDCEQCHNTSNWNDADFSHNSFPIFSGSHRNEWDSCSDCHINGNFPQFECILCHEHNQADTDDEHDEVGGYVYDSAFCYDCHPNGEED